MDANSNKPRKGFDRWISFNGQGKYRDNKLNIDGKEVINSGYITDELNRYAIEFIEQNSEKPFCLFLSHKAVHVPFMPPERHKNLFENDVFPEPVNYKDDLADKPGWQRLSKYYKVTRVRDDNPELIPPMKRTFVPWLGKAGLGQQKDYFRCIVSVDEGIGQIYEMLERKNILENSLIAFAGDNGFFHGEHGQDDKRQAYEESMRIPFIMLYPKMIKAGSTVNEMVLNIDFAPTFLDIAKVRIPSRMQGRSMSELFESGHMNWRKSFLFTYWPDYISQIPRITAVRTENYLYATYPDTDYVDELYDLRKDVYEMRNLAGKSEYASVQKMMQQELERLKKETGYEKDPPLPQIPADINLKHGLLYEADFNKFDFSSNKKVKIYEVLKEKTEKGLVGRFDDKSYLRFEYTPDMDSSKGAFVVDCLVKSECADAVVASCGNQKQWLGDIYSEWKSRGSSIT